MRTVTSEYPRERTWTVAELPSQGRDSLDSIEIEVRYTGEGNVGKAIALDHHVIPLFKAAPGMLDVLERLLEWAERMGGWEAQVWDAAQGIVDLAHDRKEENES